MDKVCSPGLFTNGSRIHCFPVQGSFVVGEWCSNSWKLRQVIMHPAGKKKALALSKSLLMFEMSKIPVFTCRPHNSSLALNAATASADLSTVVLPWSDRLISLSRLNMSHKQVLQPLLFLWDALTVVTVFLKEISEGCLVTQKLWPVIFLYKDTSLLCIREDVCALVSISLSCAKRRELRVCT